MPTQWLTSLLILFTILGANGVLAWSIPGMIPKNYERGQSLDILAGQLRSPRTSLEFDFYALNWCDNYKQKGYNPDLAGMSLRGTPLVESPYRYAFDEDMTWHACSKNLTMREIQEFSFYIQHNYSYSLYVDDLPAAYVKRDSQNREMKPNYMAGIPIGVFDFDPVGNQRIMLYNHLDMTVTVHKTREGYKRIVGFEVEPYSIAEDEQRNEANPSKTKAPLYLKPGEEFSYTFRIITREDKKMTWAMRLDHYIKIGDNDIHAAQIIYSATTLISLILLFTIVIHRNIRKDLANVKLNEVFRKDKKAARTRVRTEASEEASLTGNDSSSGRQPAEVGWKKIQDNVFRNPSYPAILAVMCGIGAQGIYMASVILMTLIMGLVNPFLRSYVTFQSFFVLAAGGAVNGFVTAIIMKYFGSKEWQFSALGSAVVLPGYMFGIFILVECIEVLERSSSAFPFGTGTALMLVWVLVTIPAALFGSYAGFVYTDAVQPACKVSSVRRRIPPQKWYQDIFLQSAISGLVIFGMIFSEFQYVLMSVWRSYMYGMFMLLWANLALLAIVVSLISIITTYMTINGQDWEWWWRSFFNGASAGVWMFIYCIYAMTFSLKMDLLSGALIYMLYMCFYCTIFSFACGFMSVASSFIFIKFIYRNSRID